MPRKALLHLQHFLAAWALADLGKEYQKEEKLGLVIVETSPMTWHGICRCFDDSHGGVRRWENWAFQRESRCWEDRLSSFSLSVHEIQDTALHTKRKQRRLDS